MRRALLALVLVAVIGGCSSSDDGRSAPPTTRVGKDSTTTSVDDGLGTVARAAGCGAIKHLDPPDDRYDPSSRVSCVAKGHHVVIDGFGGAPPPADWLRSKYPAGSLTPCPDGSPVRGPWVVLGESWALFTNSSTVADLVVRELQGDRLDPGDAGPPVSTPLDTELICEARKR